MRTLTVAVVILSIAGLSISQTIQIDKGIVTAKDSLKARLKLPEAMSGDGKLSLTWSDSYGRSVAVENKDVQLTGASLDVTLPLARAVAMKNDLSAELTAAGKAVKFPKASFVVTPADVWDDYQVMMYYEYKPQYTPNLRACGINAGQAQGGTTQSPDGSRIWWENNFRFYCDQLIYEYLATYHSPTVEPKDKRLKEAKAAYKPTLSKEALYRKPCFHDKEARAAAMARVRQAAVAQQPFSPFFYTTDECGVANLVEAFDFCYDPRTLEAMRAWLVKQHGGLEGINKQWGTKFERLQDVQPLTTDEMMARGDDNLSSWADHRTFMNLTFADVVKECSDTVKSVYPTAKHGLIGCQMPAAFGGYDYWLLSEAMDTVEPYNIGNNRELWRSFAPDKPATVTSFGAGDMEVWRLWYQALHGDLGIIIYDEKNLYLDDKGDGAPTKLGLQVAPLYKELSAGLVKQLHLGKRVDDPIAIHYSHPSITAHWMFERRPLGKGWLDKGSWHERRESEFLRLRQSLIYLLEDNGLGYKFVSYEQLGNGSFEKMGVKVLFLPQSVAMSKAECEAVRRFVEAGGTVIADCRTAIMDEHCKIQEKGQLDDLFGIQRKDMKFAPGKAAFANVLSAEPGVSPAEGSQVKYKTQDDQPAVIVKNTGKGKTIYLNTVITDYHRWRLKPPQGEELRVLVQDLLKQAGVQGQYALTLADGKPVIGAELHEWQCGDLKIVGVHRNYGLNVSELGPPEYQKQAALEVPMELKLTLPADSAIYDQRAGKLIGKQKSVTFSLDKYQPTVLSILPEPVKALNIDAPKAAKCGELVAVKLKLEGEKLGDAHVFRCQLLDSAGKEMGMLTQNLAAPKGQATWSLPLAVSDPAGEYTIQVKDVATGISATAKLTVK